MEKIAIFGAGRMAAELLQKFEAQKEIFNDTVVCVLDNDIKKMGSCIHGYIINSPSELLNISLDYIVIACNFYEDIVWQLKKDYAVEERAIISSKDYSRKKVSEYQFRKNWERGQQLSQKQWNIFNLASVVVYTAIIGDYDDLKVPSVINSNWRYVCFTDNKSLKSDIWEIRYVENVNKMEAPLFVRQFKLCPHRFFPEYDTSIWMDANLRIEKDLAILMENYQRHADILFFPHPDRICVYDEGVVCIYWKKDDKKNILGQMQKYLEDDYPYDHGLLSGGFIVRNHNKCCVAETMEIWWNEVLNGSKRDQISLPYVLWKTKLPYDLTDLNYVKNEWFSFWLHKA